MILSRLDLQGFVLSAAIAQVEQRIAGVQTSPMILPLAVFSTDKFRAGISALQAISWFPNSKTILCCISPVYFSSFFCNSILSDKLVTTIYNFTYSIVISAEQFFGLGMDQDFFLIVVLD